MPSIRYLYHRHPGSGTRAGRYVSGGRDTPGRWRERREMGMRMSNDAVFQEGEGSLCSSIPALPRVLWWACSRGNSRSRTIWSPGLIRAGAWTNHRSGPRRGALETCERGACERELLCRDARVCDMVRDAVACQPGAGIRARQLQLVLYANLMGRTGLFVLTACLAMPSSVQRWGCCMGLRAFPVHL